MRKAVTDAETEVRYDPEAKPGVSNLLELLAASVGGDPAELAARYTTYGQLKADVAEGLVEMLRPARERFADLQAEGGYVEAVLADGAAKARSMAAPTLDRAMRAVGLLAPPGGFVS